MTAAGEGRTADGVETSGSVTAPASRAMPRVSVVMPSFNHARFIRTAIDSVLSQDYAALDLHVMDGGSRDGTVDILESYGDRLTFVSQKDKGQCDAINRGLAHLQGDVICWLNSDDLFTPGAIRHVAEAFGSHPDVDFVYGRGWTIDEAGHQRGDSGVLPLDVWKLIHQRNFIQQPSCFFRRSLFERVGPVDEGLFYVMDWDLWIRFAAHRGLFLDEYLSCNREYGANKTQSGQFERWHEIKRMVRRYTGRRWPPVVWLYLIEATIQKARNQRWSRWIDAPLSRVFVQGMVAEMSGCYPDGAVQQSFRISVGNPQQAAGAWIRFRPLSATVPARAGLFPVTLTWRNDAGQRGDLRLQEDGRAQRFDLPVSRDRLFTHFTFNADIGGVPLDPTGSTSGRTAVAFLDEYGASD